MSSQYRQAENRSNAIKESKIFTDKEKRIELSPVREKESFPQFAVIYSHNI